MAQGHSHLPGITQLLRELLREGPWIQTRAVWLLGRALSHCTTRLEVLTGVIQLTSEIQTQLCQALGSFPPLSPGAPDIKGKPKKEEPEGGRQEPPPMGPCGPRFHSLEKGIKPDILPGLSSSGGLIAHGAGKWKLKGPGAPCCVQLPSYH